MIPKLISHRGNVSVRNVELENSPDYILAALRVCDMVEVDAWVVRGSQLFFGHDGPQFACGFRFLHDYARRLLVHAKNVSMLDYVLGHADLHGFWHEGDQYAMTSHGFIVTLPNNPLTSRSICMNPDMYSFDDVVRCYGVCCDDILGLKGGFEEVEGV